MRIKKLIKSKHYEIFHEHEVSWTEIQRIILSNKYFRKVKGKFKINTKDYYILGEFKNGEFIVINAKKK